MDLVTEAALKQLLSFPFPSPVRTALFVATVVALLWWTFMLLAPREAVEQLHRLRSLLSASQHLHTQHAAFRPR